MIYIDNLYTEKKSICLLSRYLNFKPFILQFFVITHRYQMLARKMDQTEKFDHFSGHNSNQRRLEGNTGIPTPELAANGVIPNPEHMTV